MAKKREVTNAAFREAAAALGVRATAKSKGRRPGALGKDGRPRDAEQNPTLEGEIDGHRLFVVNFTGGGESTARLSRFVVTPPQQILPASVSMSARLAGPFSETANPIVTILERIAAATGGSAVRPRARSSPRSRFGSKWTQLDDIDEKGIMTAAKFDWPAEAPPPPHGTPDAMMTLARTAQLRTLLELGGPWIGTVCWFRIDERRLTFQTTEQTEPEPLVDIVRACVAFADTLIRS